MNDALPTLIEPEPFTWVRYPLHRRTRFTAGLEHLSGVGGGPDSEKSDRASAVLIADGGLDSAGPVESVDPALVAQARGKVFTEELRSVTSRVLGGRSGTRVSAPDVPTAPKGPVPGDAPSAVAPVARPILPVSEPERSAPPDAGAARALQSLRWMRPPLAPHPDAVMRWLHGIYAGRVPVTESTKAVNQYLLSLSGADAFALLLPEADEFLYRVALHDGLDATTAANLTFALNDDYLQKAQPHGLLRFRDFDEDFFFKKRLGTLFFRTHELLLLLDLQPHGETGFLCFFYREAVNCDHEAVRGSFGTLMSDLAPVIRRRRIGAESGTDLNRRLFRLMRKLTDGGKHPLSVVNMRVVDIPTDVSGRHALRDSAEQVRSLLSPAERIVLLPPDRMVVLMSHTDEQLVIDRLHQSAAQSGYRVAVSMRRYPEAGRNLLNYAQMP